MFWVMLKDSKKKEPMMVYDIKQNNNGYPHFLVYKDREWRYMSAKLFEPTAMIYQQADLSDLNNGVVMYGSF